MVIEKAVEEFKEIMDSWCTHCGECCKKQAVFLTDVEAPIIAQSLKELGDISLVKKHLRINSTVFNLWHRFVLHFDDYCPFHIDDRCSIYSERPLTCQLYPMNLIGFIDRPESDLRTACLEIVGPPENHACAQSYDGLISVGKRIFEKQPKLVDDVYQFLASTYIDKSGLGYLFGQAGERGKEAVSLSTVTPTANEIVMAILEHYRNQLDGQSEIPDEILDYSEVISDEDITRLISDTASRTPTRETSKRIKLLEKFNPRLMEYWLERSST
jgi:Fe-S-cluster containining protein